MTVLTPRARIGVFDGQQDFGSVARSGVATFDPALGRYRLTASGGDFWGPAAAFHFVWKRISGDASLAMELPRPREGSVAVMIRQSLERDSIAAIATVPGDGRAVLRLRDIPDGEVVEVASRVRDPRRIRLEKRGLYVSMSTAGDGEDLRSAGGATLLPIVGDFFIGIATHAPEPGGLASFDLADVELSSRAETRRSLVSTLEAISIATRRRRVIHCTGDHIEAPNWAPDGETLLFNGRGRIYGIPSAGGTPAPIDTGFAVRCNNDHGLSPDGRLLVISDQSEEERSIIYVLPVTGGEPRRITALGPSYWHGWSPDGATLAYCAYRDGRFGVFTTPIAGGDERRVTTAAPNGLDDGPDYSPDGAFIYFNSDRSGRMQIWRVHPDGSGMEQVTHDEYSNWFPHPSPDGRWIVMLSYGSDIVGHPPNKDVQLRLMPSAGGAAIVLARFFGGQGTINVPSWSPDSREIAFVSYELIP
jgi:Tol biopolymer transport system component